MPNTPSNAASTTTRSSRTSTEAPKKVIPVLKPFDKAYLSSHICFCNCFPIISKSGMLKQRCVTNAIRLECAAANQVWLYKAEVGYNMRTVPPKPLMSAKNEAGRNPRPSYFPLGAAMAQGVYLSKDNLEGGVRSGLLRIPDIIIVKDMNNFSLEQNNIERVVEIKFGKDDWRAGQEEDYQKIAGGGDKLTLLSAPDSASTAQEAETNFKNKVGKAETDEEVCHCKDCNEEKENRNKKNSARKNIKQSIPQATLQEMGINIAPTPIHPASKPPQAGHSHLGGYLFGGGLIIAGGIIFVLGSPTGAGEVVGALMIRMGGLQLAAQ